MKDPIVMVARAAVHGARFLKQIANAVDSRESPGRSWDSLVLQSNAPFLLVFKLHCSRHQSLQDSLCTRLCLLGVFQPHF